MSEKEICLAYIPLEDGRCESFVDKRISSCDLISKVYLCPHQKEIKVIKEKEDIIKREKMLKYMNLKE